MWFALPVEHLELVAGIARRWQETEDEHTRLELLLELRTGTGAGSELEVIALLLQAVAIESERADNKAAECERWFVAWRDIKKPDNWRGDKRHLLKR